MDEQDMTIQMNEDPFSFLALGDSYTIGEAVELNDRWPMQLVRRLDGDEIKIETPEIVATTGWTTDELQKAIIKENITAKYDIVSLLIGVNNQYRGYPIAQYEKEFTELLDQAIEFALDDKSLVFVISIPDYGVTPFAGEKGLDSEKIAVELDEYNRIAKSICENRGVSFTDITKDSKKAKEDLSLVASDGLHPSGKMYENWVDLVYTTVYNNLSLR